MIGKANLPKSFESKSKIRGSAENAPGWDALDQERAASMADEGGKSAVDFQRIRDKFLNINKSAKNKNPPASFEARGSRKIHKRSH